MKMKAKRIISVTLMIILALSAVFAAPTASAKENDDNSQTAVIETADGDLIVTTDEDEGLSQTRSGSKGQVFVTAPVGANIDEEETQPADETEQETQPTEVTQAATEAATEIATEAPTQEITVGKVKNLRKTSSNVTYITLRWSAAENATGYKIYWRKIGSDTAAFKFLSKTTTTRISAKNLTGGTAYEFQVKPYKKVKAKVYEGEAATIKTATNPNKVANFRLLHAASSITVAWSKNDRVDGYILYRQHAATNGKFVKYKTLSKSTTSYTDKNVSKGRAYYYRILAYRKLDSKTVFYGEYSEVKSVCGLCASKNNGSKTMLSKVFLKWSKCKYAKGYQIFYSTDNKNFKKLATTTSTSYTTHKLSYPNKVYYFRIYPYTKVGTKQTFVRGTYLAMNFKVSDKAYGKSTGDTYVEVNIAKQHLQFYYKGKLYVDTDVVTGNYHSMDTPKGYWNIYQHMSPATLTGPGYSTRVSYWMAFSGGCGIHDSSWRSAYGGNIYKGNGSHGCVNTPYSKVKKIFQKTKIGTPVIVY